MSLFSVTDQWQKHMAIEIPPLWQVIYYEGIHGHHILFSPSDLTLFENPDFPSTAAIDQKQVTKIGYSLLRCRSFREMVSIIDQWELGVRWQIFRLYKQWLKDIEKRIKSSAH
ncbi:MAG: hypothetical protein HRU09_05080 [Oligoflexales bacterium]|nr:hypothetical protein [Oligoflexales bacterium]